MAIERGRPGRGYRHVVTQSDVYDFVRLVPGWEQMSVSLNRILLDAGSRWLFGWFRRGVVALCAMPRDLVIGLGKDAYYRDLDFFERCGVDCRFQTPEEQAAAGDDGELSNSDVLCRFTRSQARCFHLTRTLLHELGHHLDLISNRKQRCTRGEDFAERIRRDLDQVVWPRYVRCFGEP